MCPLCHKATIGIFMRTQSEVFLRRQILKGNWHFAAQETESHFAVSKANTITDQHNSCTQYTSKRERKKANQSPVIELLFSSDDFLLTQFHGVKIHTKDGFRNGEIACSPLGIDFVLSDPNTKDTQATEGECALR